MAKDPAFLFYPGDWQLGTMHMTLLEKGAYMELLMLQFARGKFTEAQAKHMLNGSFEVVWATVVEKFYFDGKHYLNKRLEEEKEKRRKFTESRRANGLVEKTHQKDKEAYAKHTDKRMEDENDNEDIDKNKEDMVVQEMMKIWMKHKPRYAKELEKDSHCLLALAYKIAEYKGWKRADVVGSREKDILTSWEKIVKYVVADTWYQTKSLTIVNSQWQSLVEQMDAAKNGTTVKKKEEKVTITLPGKSWQE